MRLISLRLTNFKGIPSFTLDAQGNDLAIEAQNGAGKTSIADAWTFLLTGKDSLGQSPGTGGFEIKTLDAEGKVKRHGLDHTVEAVIESEDRKYTLMKVYREKWTTRRGASDKVFEGHEVLHWIDGVPKDLREYQAFLATICDPKRLLILTKPAHFNEMPDDSKLGPGWQQRRSILIEAFGDVTDASVLDSHERFAPLSAALKGKSVDDFKKATVPERKRLVADRSEIRPRIDELNRQLKTNPAQTSGGNLGSHSDPALDLEEMRNRLKALALQRAELKAGGPDQEKKRRLRELEDEAESLARQARLEADRKREEAEKTLRQTEFVLRGETQKYEQIVHEIAMDEQALGTVEASLKTLKEEHAHIGAETSAATEPSACPTCGQPLPLEQLAEAREQFNLSKARRLEKNLADQAFARERIGKLEAKLERKAGEVMEIEQSMIALEQDVEAARAVIAPLNTSALPLTDRQSELNHLIGTLRSDIRIEQAPDTSNLDSEMAELESKIAAAQEADARAKAQDDAKARIKELEASEKKLGKEIEALDKLLFLVDEFTKAKVASLDDKINGQFSLVKWKLSEVQINEGIKDVCVCTMHGTPWSSLSTGERIIAGLDIIRTLSQAWGLAVPCFVDNSESVTMPLEAPGQLIALRAVEGVRELTVRER